MLVTSAADAGEGSLRAAIDLANDDPDSDYVAFDFEAMGSDTIKLASQLPDVASPVTIDGQGRLTLVGGGTGGHRHLYVGATGDLTIRGVTLTEGGGGGTENDRGGAIFNHGGVLTIVDSTISHSSASASGGVRNRGQLQVTNSDFVANGNAFGCAGGAIDNKADGVAEIDSSRFVDNIADVGGAVINDGGEMTINGSTFTGNEALNWAGGGVLNDAGGPMTITNSVFRENKALVGAGVTNRGTLLLEDVEISRNISREGGGGIGNFVGDLTLRRSVVSNNEGGGILSGVALRIEQSRITGNRGIGWGGVFGGGELVVESSVISENEATGGVDANVDRVNGNGGGIFAIDGTFEVRNSLISSNTAEFGGGAIWAERASGLVLNTTLSANVAGEPGGAVHVLDGSVELIFDTVTANEGATILFNNGGQMAIVSTLVAGNVGAGCAGDRFTRVTSSLTDDPSCGQIAGFEFVENAGLGSLAENGGPTETHALLSTSPAIDAAAGCTTLDGALVDRDQRGEPRPIGGRCDIGALEVQ